MVNEENIEKSSDGSVSLNMPKSATIGPTSAQPADQSFSLDSVSSGANNLAVDDIHVPIEGEDPFSSQDEEIGDLANDDVVDEPQTSSFFKKPNFKLWSGILGTSLVLLVGVFFFLAQQTTLFQGAITQILDDEPILEDGPVIDNTDEGAGTTTEPTSDGNPDIVLFDEPVAGEGDTEPTIGDLPTIADASDGFIGEPIVDDNDLANLLAETTTPTINDTIIIGGTSPTTTPTITNDGTIVINDPAFNSPANVPTDTVIIASTTPQSSAQANITNSIPTLNSNTNSQVLGSAEVQGNTGPGVLIYFAGPLGFAIYRKLKKYAA